MSVFRPSQAYRADLDIRLGAGRLPSWIRPPAEGAAPNSAAWLVVMPRRAGKTWLAQGIADLRAAGGIAAAGGGTVRVDLRSSASVRRTGLGCLTGADAQPPVGEGQLVIVDEPALARPGGPGVPPEVLAEGLQRVGDTGATAMVLATPAESALLVPHLGPDVRKDILRPPVLDAGESGRMAARAPQWAPALVDWLRQAEPGWLHTPFLLELVLHTAEERPALRDEPEALLRAAVEVAEDRHEYIQQWFHNGLGEQHRTALRAGRWRAAGLSVALPAAEQPGARRYGPAPGAEDRQDEVRGGAPLADDPVLARHLPEVLRVHHISDLHHGGRLSSLVDSKDPTQAGHRIATVAGAGTALDSYLDHVRQLAAQGRAPHLVVVTGDVVDRPSDTHGAIARGWLDELAGLLAPHRDLRPDDPRVLLVGGNHDVSWDLALDPSPQARHRWFAANFAGLPHPDLQLADPRARRLYVGYRGVGLRFALLGSAESGGEAARDEDRELLRGFRERYLAAAGATRDAGAGGGTDTDTGTPAGAASGPHGSDGADVAAVVRDFERHDPGVIARGVLDRLAPERGYVTVAALHHPLSPVPAVEVAPYSGVVNAGQAKRALAAARTSLVLHGHTHLGFAAAERLLGSGPPWTVRIAGAPALASRETEERNGYNELFVSREGGAHTLAVRTVRLDGGQWTPGEVFAFRPGAADERDLAELCADGRP
ncbi:metallophosphoesterase [Actinacidiphila bryophytorum]|uniref:metallophosphoesterase n=1 Tax=Actinacidiphila bryophytorum TaxID=1436133 RepID=UPI002176E82F|nr:metallophosphoesterase [Actinacidiphila bryophytorum]UWE11451.1 metallophosphoesterase [Actinacidiphila bryophytorum]